jgi:hypothetical protein
MKTQDIANLTEQELKDLMYAICRSGKVVIPQYYFTNHIKNFLGVEPTTDDMNTIQSVFESDWTTHEYLDDAVTEIIDNNL